MTLWSYWLARLRLLWRTTRAQRAAARRFADDILLALWLADNPPGQPIEDWTVLPLSRRRRRQALVRRFDAKQARIAAEVASITDADVEAGLAAAHAEVDRRQAAGEGPAC